MKEFLEELEEFIAEYESNTWQTVSFELIFKQDRVLKTTHWNGDFTDILEINSFKINEDVNLKDCVEEDDFMKSLSNIVSKYSEKFESVSFILGFSLNKKDLDWDMFVWNGSYKYAGEFEHTDISTIN